METVASPRPCDDDDDSYERLPELHSENRIKNKS